MISTMTEYNYRQKPTELTHITIKMDQPYTHQECHIHSGHQAPLHVSCLKLHFHHPVVVRKGLLVQENKL